MYAMILLCQSHVLKLSFCHLCNAFIETVLYSQPIMLRAWLMRKESTGYSEVLLSTCHPTFVSLTIHHATLEAAWYLTAWNCLKLDWWK
jgi:hypothetical protein